MFGAFTENMLSRVYFHFKGSRTIKLWWSPFIIYSKYLSCRSGPPSLHHLLYFIMPKRPAIPSSFILFLSCRSGPISLHNLFDFYHAKAARHPIIIYYIFYHSEAARYPLTICFTLSCRSGPPSHDNSLNIIILKRIAFPWQFALLFSCQI